MFMTISKNMDIIIMIAIILFLTFKPRQIYILALFMKIKTSGIFEMRS